MLTWDEAKRQINVTKHGLDFADAHRVYDHPAKITVSSPRGAEPRHLDLALVELAGTVLALVYLERGEEVRVISFRRASRKERKLHEKVLADQ